MAEGILEKTVNGTPVVVQSEVAANITTEGTAFTVNEQALYFIEADGFADADIRNNTTKITRQNQIQAKSGDELQAQVGETSYQIYRLR
jgi:hypothetical protein